MQEIDRPFRPSKGFCVVWALLLVATIILVGRVDVGPWYSVVALMILTPTFATFLLYGPFLLSRQVLRSGSRGIFVARVFLSIMGVAAILFGGLLGSGYYTETRAQILGFAFTVVATVYLNWQLDKPARRTR